MIKSLFRPLRNGVRDAVRTLRGPDPSALADARAAVARLQTRHEDRDSPNPPMVPGQNQIDALITESLTLAGNEVVDLRAWARLRNELAFFPLGGMYDWIETQILYLLIRRMRPSVVVEISPSYGYSTGIILLALNANAHGRLFSYDLDEAYHDQARRTFKRVGIDDSRQTFFHGDVRTKLATIPENIDMLFMDSDHSHEFARWYMTTLFPRVNQGGLIHVHDVLRHGVPPHQGDLGEGRALDQFLVEGRVPPAAYRYTSDLVREQPLLPAPLSEIARYPFAEPGLGTNSVEQNASFWWWVTEGARP